MEVENDKEEALTDENSTGMKRKSSNDLDDLPDKVPKLDEVLSAEGEESEDNTVGVNGSTKSCESEDEEPPVTIINHVSKDIDESACLEDPKFPPTPPCNRETVAMETTANESEAVIILSDEEKENGNEDNEIEKIKQMRNEQRIQIKKFQDELRKEEAKLILLKKLRQNQTQKPPVTNPSSNRAKTPPQQVDRQTTKPSQTITQQSQSKTSLSKSLQSSTSFSKSSSAQAQANRNAMAAMLQMPQLVAAAGGSREAQNALLRAHPAINLPGPAQLLLGNQGDISSKMQQLLQQQQKLLQQPPQTFKQQQASAKLALRKQLEKTLLEIPPPKPPPPEITFLPSAASNEFICLMGLEEVVTKIQQLQNKGNKVDENVLPPFICVQCEKDFSPLWKVNKEGDQVMCLQCVMNNQKKALKAEHTNRLKTAFVKALQQEQEIEQKIQQQQQQQKSSDKLTGNETLEAAVAAAASQLQKQQEQLKKLQENQLRHHQHLLQRAQQQIQQQQRSFAANFRPTAQQIRNAMAPVQFGFGSSGGSSKNGDRQFLLDMIPSRSPSNSSKQQSKGKWK